MSSLREASYSVNSFSMKLFSKLAKNEQTGNIFYSPASICIALAMTYAGAKGNTAKEVEKFMGWNTPEEVHEMMKNLQESMFLSSGASGIELKVANRLWAQGGFPILQEFTKILNCCYRAEMGVEDFSSKAEEARKAINQWVEEKTNAKIKDLLKEGVLTSDTKLVLTNAVYFKGFWQDEFDALSTHDWDFKVTKNKTTKIKLMNKTAQFMYAKNKSLSCQVLRLPYKQKTMAMLVLLPDEDDGLAKLEDKMNADRLRKCNRMLTQVKVSVSLPKFTTNCQFKLRDVLQELGIHDLFRQNADLSGLTGKKDLFVSEVVHQAFVDVNEQGTEAAAATAVKMVLKRALPVERPPRFLADHPFLFVIQHCESGAILFAGRIVNPESS